MSTFHLDSLSKATVDIHYPRVDVFGRLLDPDVTNLISGIRNVKTLNYAIFTSKH